MSRFFSNEAFAANPKYRNFRSIPGLPVFHDIGNADAGRNCWLAAVRYYQKSAFAGYDWPYRSYSASLHRFVRRAFCRYCGIVKRIMSRYQLCMLYCWGPAILIGLELHQLRMEFHFLSRSCSHLSLPYFLVGLNPWYFDACAYCFTRDNWFRASCLPVQQPGEVQHGKMAAVTGPAVWADWCTVSSE